MSNQTPPHKQVASEQEALQLYQALHDLKAPLASMQGLMTLFKKEVTDKMANCYLELFEKCVGRLNTIVSSLQDIFLYRHKELQIGLVNVSAAVTNILESLRHMEGAKEIEFTTEVPPGLQYSGDCALFESIIQNVIHNSVLYRNQGKKSFVRIEVCKKGDGIGIAIEDNGKGIQPAVLPHVFDMFYRGDLQSKGCGLGLYIVKNNTSLLKGTVEIESVPGKGTKVSIHLPNLR